MPPSRAQREGGADGGPGSLVVRFTEVSFMADMIHKGTKIADAERAALDPAQMLIGRPDAEVEGQDCYGGNSCGVSRFECPWCGNYQRIDQDTDYYEWFECNLCKRAFRA